MPLPTEPALPAAPEPAFRDLAALVREHAQRAPDRPAVRCGEGQVSYGELDALIDRVAAGLQRDGLRPCDVIAICAAGRPTA